MASLSGGHKTLLAVSHRSTDIHKAGLFCYAQSKILEMHNNTGWELSQYLSSLKAFHSSQLPIQSPPIRPSWLFFYWRRLPTPHGAYSVDCGYMFSHLVQFRFGHVRQGVISKWPRQYGRNFDEILTRLHVMLYLTWDIHKGVQRKAINRYLLKLNRLIIRFLNHGAIYPTRRPRRWPRSVVQSGRSFQSWSIFTIKSSSANFEVLFRHRVVLTTVKAQFCPDCHFLRDISKLRMDSKSKWIYFCIVPFFSMNKLFLNHSRSSKSLRSYRWGSWDVLRAIELRGA